MVLCSLYDKVAQKFYAPSCFDNTDCAKRDANSLFVEHFGKKSRDFSVYLVATYDNTSGVISPVAPSVILDGSALIFKDESEE